MKGLHFSSLDRSDPAVVARLQQAYVVGLDRMPWPSQIEWGNSTATVRRAISESGCLHLPWKVDGFGELYIQTSSLMERETPYSFPIEIARGQINKVRNQLADWELVGMKVPEEVVGTLKNAKGELLRAIRSSEAADSEKHAREALRWALWSAEGLTESYARRAIANRRRQRDRLPTRLGGVFDESFLTTHGKQVFRDVFNHITIPLRWNQLEAQQGECDWESFDRVVDACTSAGLPFTVGPLLDMRPQSLPSWLWLWEDDIQTVVTLMMDMVETCIGRYRGKVKSWETTARTNSSQVFNLQEEQMLWLTGKMIEVVHNVDPEAEVVLTVDQPWGEYLAHDDRSYSPFTFVDTLIRNRVRISAINLEVAMGYAPGGSFCRTLLDFSQMLDRFHELAVPLRVRLFFPSEPASSKARENKGGGAPLSTSAGRWRGPFSEAVQAEWAEKCILLAIAKPYVEVVTWGSYHDRADEATDWPASGLVDHAGRPKQTLDRIRKIRKAYVE